MITNAKKIVIGFAALVLVSWLSPETNYGKSLCEGPAATLDCLKKNSYELYSNNPTLFWKILHQAADKAYRCDKPNSTVQFLELIQAPLDGDLYEFYSEQVEKLGTAKPECLLNALAVLKKEDLTKIINMLRKPLVTEPQEIDRIFRDNRNNEKYKEIVELYFEKTSK